MTTLLPAAITAPYSEEAEQAVLGAVLVNPNTLPGLITFLKADDFFLLRHNRIWQAFKRLTDRDEDIDFVTISAELKNMGVLDEVGGQAYLMQLINSTPTSVHAEIYGRLVQRTAFRRQMLEAADVIRDLALDEEKNTEQVYLEAQRRLNAIQVIDRQQLVSGAYSNEMYSDIVADLMLRRDSGEMNGYPLPASWGGLSERMPALIPGWLVVISGGTGSGKTAGLECLAEWFASIGLRVKYNHTEVRSEDMLHRRMARHSGIPYINLATGNMPDSFYERYKAAEKRIAEWMNNLDYHWMPDAPFIQLAADLRADADAGVQVIIIDHFQDISFPGEENPVRAYEKAAVWLTAFAEKRRVLLVVASQQNDSGKVKWSRKLAEKASVHISIRRDVLTNDYSYTRNGIEYLSRPGGFAPISTWKIEKARFTRPGKQKMLYHGAGFEWLDAAEVRKFDHRVIPFTEVRARQWAQGDE